MAERLYNKKTADVTLSGEVTVVMSDPEITRAFKEVVGDDEKYFYEVAAKLFIENPAMFLAKVSAAAEKANLDVARGLSYLDDELTEPIDEPIDEPVKSPVVR